MPSSTVIGDRRQLTILFSNLLANAVFYSHEGGRVEVSSVIDGNEVCVRVEDHGIGIAPEALPRIFDEYFRTKEGSRFNKRSTGLGLSIVSKIVHNLHLRIKVASEQGKGTMFEVIIPGQQNSVG